VQVAVFKRIMILTVGTKVVKMVRLGYFRLICIELHEYTYSKRTYL